MISNAIAKYQDQGSAPTLSAANLQKNSAERITPDDLRPLFRSYIKWESGEYVWGWVLK